MPAQLTQLEPFPVKAAGGVDGTERPRKRVLFVSYVFPPVGGAGVQRTTKFIKYLPSRGWMPSVLTVENPSVPAWDKSLLADIPDDVIVRRARTMEPGYGVKNSIAATASQGGAGRIKGAIRGAVRGMVKFALQPDPQVLWVPAAVREGKRLLAEIPHDVIVVSGPPFSSFLIGRKLSRWAGIPLMLDYRDEWDISNAYLENKRLDAFSLWVQKKMQARVVRAASALVATTQSSAQALDRIKMSARSAARVQCIYNGYDPSDFPETPRPRAQRDRFRMAYVGTLWNLTSVRPVVAAIKLLADQSPELAAKLEIIFVGRRTPEQQAMLGELNGLPCRLVEHPYLPHDEALDLVGGADALCVLLSDVPGAERVVPAKIFEYMAARRAILAVAPRGEMWELLADHPAALLHTPGDVSGIAGALAQEIKAFEAGGSRTISFDAVRHSRPAETAQLAELLDTLVTK